MLIVVISLIRIAHKIGADKKNPEVKAKLTIIYYRVLREIPREFRFKASSSTNTFKNEKGGGLAKSCIVTFLFDEN